MGWGVKRINRHVLPLRYRKEGKASAEKGKGCDEPSDGILLGVGVWWSSIENGNRPKLLKERKVREGGKREGVLLQVGFA